MAKMEKHERVRLKEAILAALAALREVFPLERRVAMAPAPVKAAYIEVLNRWRGNAVPPRVDDIDPDQRATLVELDMVVEQKNGLGCYPFSADDTPFRVRCAGDESVYAFCALDALAIPCLLGQSAWVEAHCASCGRALYCEVAGDGALPEQAHDRMVMVWEPVGRSVAGSEACCRTLCPHIRFMCASCAGWSGAQIFTLPQAAAVANAFFAFQRRLNGGRREA